MSTHKVSNKNLIFLDLETTGLIRHRDRIVEIGIYLKNFLFPESSEYHSYINPGFHISNEVSRIHKITDDTVIKKPKFNEIILDLLKIFELGEFCVAYNGKSFDKPRLLDEITPYCKKNKISVPVCLTRSWIDPFLILKNPQYQTLFKDIKNLKLTTLAEHLGLPKYVAHTAMEDTIALAQVFKILVDEDIVPDNINKILLLQSQIENIDKYLDD